MVIVRHLLVLRHAEAEAGGTDFERDLTDKAKRDAQRIGVWLARHALIPDAVVSSPARRAKVTAQKSAKTAGLNADCIRYDERIYTAGWKQLLSVVQETPDAAHCLLLVGHNPGVSQLLRKIGNPAGSPSVSSLCTGGLAHLRFQCGWSDITKQSGDWGQAVQPGDLPREFPFPGPQGVESRPRPAYYYRQSSVIPYRVTGNSIEVLIVSSSSGARWVVPKGIHDPGMSAEDSAANEAFEEAGVLGDVTGSSIGQYEYNKWGGTCSVTVFPMLVTRELTEAEWPERHRGRKWVSVDDAVAMVENKDLKQIIAKILKPWRVNRSETHHGRKDLHPAAPWRLPSVARHSQRAPTLPAD